jgi:sec-independent protein translocase protein TatA
MIVRFGIGSLGFTEIALILLLIVLLFGASRLPEIGKGLGKGISNFKKSVKGEDDASGPPAP